MEPESTPPIAPFVEPASYDHFVTEDDAPVDNLLSEKLMRLLTEPLYSSRANWVNGRKFLASADVGLFYHPDKPPVVPDVLLSLDVQAADLSLKKNRSYFVWVFGKPPDVVIEIVSNDEGGEADTKMAIYAEIGVPYYVIHDPFQFLSKDELRVYGLHNGGYEPVTAEWMQGVGLGLTLWRGTFEEMEEVWLRWSDHNGQVLPTGAERARQEKQFAEQEKQRAEQEKQRAEQEKQRAEQEKQRAERLAERLRSLGIDPDA